MAGFEQGFADTERAAASTVKSAGNVTRAARALERAAKTGSINEWDLRRLYPESQPETEGKEFEFRFEEIPEMEKEVKDDAEISGD